MAILDPAPGQGEMSPGDVAQGQGPQAGGGGVEAMIQGIGQNMIDLMSIMESAGAPEPVMQQLAGSLKGFQQAIMGLQAGPEGEGQAPQRLGQEQGNVSPEAGAAQVRPM